MGDRRRRREDPPDVDHSEERVTDWKTVMPRWLLIALFTLSVSGNAFLGASVVGLGISYYELGRSADNDPKWGAIGDHAERLGKVETKVDQHEYLIRALDVRTQLTDVQGDVKILKSELRILSERLAKKGL